MSHFASRWNNERTPGFSDKVKEVIRADKEPVKPKLEQAVRQIKTQIVKLDQTSGKLKARDANIFNSVVLALQIISLFFSKKSEPLIQRLSEVLIYFL